MEDRKEEIIMLVAALFMTKGIKSHTMDDISKHLKISKKTLYKICSSKKDLVNQTMTLLMNQDVEMCLEALEEGGNAIDKIYSINKRVSEKLQMMQSIVIYDLMNHYPEAWEIMQKHKTEFIADVISKGLIEGIKEGLFRNMNVEIIAAANINMIYSIFEGKFFTNMKYSFAQVHEEIATYHIRGIANEKGLAYIDKLTSN